MGQTTNLNNIWSQDVVSGSSPLRLPLCRPGYRWSARSPENFGTAGSLERISRVASGALNWLVPVPLKRALVTCAPGCAVICCSYLRPKLKLIVFESGLRLVKQKQDQWWTLLKLWFHFTYPWKCHHNYEECVIFCKLGPTNTCPSGCTETWASMLLSATGRKWYRYTSQDQVFF